MGLLLHERLYVWERFVFAIPFNLHTVRCVGCVILLLVHHSHVIYCVLYTYDINTFAWCRLIL
jgi:hypothetical protein